MREVGGFVTDAQNRFCCSASNEAVGNRSSTGGSFQAEAGNRFGA